MKGLLLACRYSYGCRTTSGIDGANKTLQDFVLDPKEDKIEQVKDILRQLSSYPWYQVIARMLDSDDFFARDVVRCFWEASSLLPVVQEALLNDISLEGLDPVKRALFKKQAMRMVNLPAHHNYTIFSLFPQSKSLDLLCGLIDGFNDCCVRPAEIIIIKRNSYVVKVPSVGLNSRNGNLVFLPSVKREIGKGFVSDAKEGKCVTVRFGAARAKIDYKRAAELRRIFSVAFGSFVP